MILRRRPKKRIVKEKSCGVILYRMDEGERHYLFLHYPGGHWDFPKGHVEKKDKGEKATAFRELKEETGIDKIEFIPGYREPMFYDFHRGRREIVKKTVIYFLAVTKGLDVKLSHEHQGAVWLTYEEGLQQLTYENARDLLKKAEQHLTQ